MATAVADPKERAVQESLEAVTWPGESLLAFTQCRLNPGEFLDKTYCVGLTQRRFLLFCKAQPDRVFSIYRSLVERACFRDGGLLRGSGLELVLGGETILLETVQPWIQRAKKIVEKHNEWELESPYLTSTQFLESITDLSELGLLRPAQTLLRKHMAEDPVVEIEPRSTELDHEINQGRWSLWISLAMLALALLYSLGRVLCGSAWAGAGIVPVILLLCAGVQLARCQRAWRSLALIFALLAAMISLGYSGFASLAAINNSVGPGFIALSPSVMNSLAWIAFCAANILVLTGIPHRTRNISAAVIFAAGFLTPLLFTGISVAAPVIFGDPQARFQDDFSSSQGWIIRENSAYTSHIENDAYAVHVREGNSTFYAFPPLHYNPEQASLDIEVPEAFRGLVGTYGVTCNYTDYEGSYLVEIDPAGSQYAFLKHDGGRFTSLTAGYWQPITGTQLNRGKNHLEVSCADREISLKINGVEQGKASVPGFSWHGKMGLFVRTWPESAPQGFKVLFDNVDFARSRQP